jgi:hypothetical protein
MYYEHIEKEVMTAEAVAALTSMATSATPLIVKQPLVIVTQPVIDKPDVIEVIPPFL